LQVRRSLLAQKAFMMGGNWATMSVISAYSS
jgi:hypothetical protein